MQWAVWSETFFARDISALSGFLGENLIVYSLKPSSYDYQQIEKNLGISSIKNKKATFCKFILGLLTLIREYKSTYGLLHALFKNEKDKRLIFKSVLLFPMVFYIVNDIYKNNITIAHLYWGHYPSMIGWVLKKKKWNGYLSITFSAYDVRMDYRLSVITANLADKVFTISNYNKNILINRGVDKKKIEVVYGGISISTNQQNALHNPNRNEAEFIFIGRLVEAKGIPNLMAALNFIDEMNLKLHIVGKGPLEKLILDRAKYDNRIIYHGLQSPDWIMKKLNKVGSLIHPSYVEMIPNVVKEAMLNGAIVVSSKTDGIDEMITDRENGFIMSENNAETIADYIHLVMKLSEDRKHTIRYKAYRSIQQKFDVQKNMNTYYDIWKNELLSKT